jgi:glycosyltransferase involved in cell wall biosynthesis
MKIAYVSKEFGPVTGGGIGTYIANVCEAFATAGHQVFLVTDCMTEAGRSLLPNGVELVPTRVSPPHQKGQFFSEHQEYSHRVLDTLRGLAQTQELDVIEFPDYRAEGFATIRAKRLLNEFAGAKLIVKCHTPASLIFEINESKTLWPAMACDFEMEDYCVRYADMVTSPSLALAEYFRERVGRADIRSCPYPMHLPPSPAPRIFDQRQVRTVRFLGSLQVRKGVDFFITAAARVLEIDPDFRFEIYGQDRNEPCLGQSYASLLAARIPESCRDRISFAGGVQYDAIPGILLKSCFCVFPSRWENWANVCLEAMAMGCVVIASNRGGMAEMIEHGKSGFLINPQNPREIADLILEQHKEVGRLEQISAAATARSRELADPESARARIVANYTRPLPARQWRQPAAKKVSVIIPFYNQGQYLAQAIQSVQDSSYRHLETIVVNDGSSDRLSNEAFESVEGVVKIRKINGGLSSARNAGIEKATGHYLLMLDADDKIHPGYIAAAVAALENNPNLGYVTCHTRYFEALAGSWIPVGFVPALMPFMNTAGACANVYRRELFATCGGYDETMVSYEDWDFLLTIYEHGLEGDVLPAEFFFYRKHFDSMVHTVAGPRRGELIQYLILKHPRLLEKHAPAMVAILARLWKQTEIELSAALAEMNLRKNSPGTSEVMRVLKQYGKRKLGKLKTFGRRAG